MTLFESVCRVKFVISDETRDVSEMAYNGYNESLTQFFFLHDNLTLRKLEHGCPMCTSVHAPANTACDVPNDGQ